MRRVCELLLWPRLSPRLPLELRLGSRRPRLQLHGSRLGGLVAKPSPSLRRAKVGRAAVVADHRQLSNGRDLSSSLPICTCPQGADRISRLASHVMPILAPHHPTADTILKTQEQMHKKPRWRGTKIVLGWRGGMLGLILSRTTLPEEKR